jgi:type I restriction enzyme S subunit
MSYPRYEAYKDSGVEWLGEIPIGWEIKKIHYVAKLKSGASITAEMMNEYDEIPVYGGNGLRGYFNAYTHDGEYILIGRQGALCGNVNYANGKFWASEHAIVVSPTLKYETLWLGELLRAMNLNQYSISAAQPGLSVEQIEKLKIPLPPLPEQQAIATFLDRETVRIDTLIAKQEQMITLLQEKRKAIISHAVTRGLDPNVPLKDSGVEWLGKVPEHWEVKRLKFIANVRTGVAKGRELVGRDLIKLPYLRVANVQDGYLDLSDVSTIDIACDEIDRYLLQPGDVLMNEGGDYDKLGRGYVWQGEIEGCVHQNHVFAVRPYNTANSFWINLATQASYAKQYFISRSKQTTNLASISSSNIQEWPVVMPPDTERQIILQVVQDETTKIDMLITKVKSAIDLLKEHRTSLISAAVTGKIDVRSL